ncbi:hypothetical protein C900_00655 [Fulvivirga imtechensis AK7]|uniref:Uncharacterized protein n=1 Tax=Fulvivirga imtechensis AK7 TaxID=1237149 RepID=L8JVZ3_9BACT|nr:hypothetical protein [Fulvivirga imtechensis]ELR72970.1 hypothetical protein C900_00655 [Fulvivirga imtechensis AK7]
MTRAQLNRLKHTIANVILVEKLVDDDLSIDQIEVILEDKENAILRINEKFHYPI